ncbi:MAG: hypothetical protein NTW61_04505, partial [Candidatus Melainabacteria bacterium]|nr:hypothetical protein [Candidatus Melainabacteria bacterium]
SAFFQWESPNGQQVLTYQLAEGYFHLFLHDETLSIAEKLAELDSLIQKIGRFEAHDEPFLLPLGGDHLGTPETAVLEAFHKHLPNATVVHPHQFMAKAQKWLAESNAEIPTHEGSLRAFASKATEAPFLLTGTLSARMKLKLANAKLEHRLTHQTERQLAWVAMATPENLPAGADFTLAKAWESLLLNHPHDSICGCSLDAVHRANAVRFDEANAYAEGLERRTQKALGLNETGIHGWNGSTVEISGVVPLSLTVEKTAPEETEEAVLARLAEQLPQAYFHTVKSILVEAYKTDFRQVPLSHLTQWAVQGWLTIAQDNALPALSVVNDVGVRFIASAPQSSHGRDKSRPYTGNNNQYQTPFFRIEWDEKSFKVISTGGRDKSRPYKGEGSSVGVRFIASVPLTLPTYRVKADVGDSYNRQPSTDALPFLLHQVVVDYQTPQAAQWQLHFQTTQGDSLTQTVLCVADEPVLSIGTQFTPTRPFIAVEMVLAEAEFPQEMKGYEFTEKASVGWDNEARGTELGRLHRVNNRMLIPLESFRVSGKYHSNEISTLNGVFSVNSYQQVGWETHAYTADQLQERQQAFPVPTSQDEWEPLGGIFQAGLQTPSHYLWQAGCYAYEVEENAVIIPLHRGFGVLSGGKMPVRGCPAGPPFETPEGQCVGETFLFEALWGSASVLDNHLPLLQKAKARLLGDVGLKGKLLEIGTKREASAMEATIIRLWETETPLPVAINLQACYPKRDKTLGDGLVFRWHNPTNQALWLPLPEQQTIWLCNLKDEPLWQLESANEVWEIAPFSWLTFWAT